MKVRNRNRLEPIVEFIIFLCQSIALRGHHDQGNLIDQHNLNEIKPSTVIEGNFLKLPRFRIASSQGRI